MWLLVIVLYAPDAPAVVALVKLPDTTIPALVDEVLVMADVKSTTQLFIVLESASFINCIAKLLVVDCV